MTATRPVGVRGPTPLRRAAVRRAVPARRARPGDRGSVTAETAIALPVLMIVLAAGVSASAAAGAQVKCIDAARAGARFAARGEPEAVSAAEAERLSPAGSRVEVVVEGARVRVTVNARVSLPLGFGLPVTASVEAFREPAWEAG